MLRLILNNLMVFIRDISFFETANIDLRTNFDLDHKIVL